MPKAVLLCALCLALAACAGNPEPLPPLPPVVTTVVKQVCIPWHEWSAADKKALHDALVPIPDGSVIIRAVRDWYRYYADAQACAAAQK